MSNKWNTQNKKIYLKIHVAVDVKTKKSFTLEATNEKVHVGKMLA